MGVKVSGADLATVDRLTGEIEQALKEVLGVSSALAERLTGGSYVDVNIRRDDAARFGTYIADVQSVISSAVGGENIGETVEGLQRFSSRHRPSSSRGVRQTWRRWHWPKAGGRCRRC